MNKRKGFLIQFTALWVAYLPFADSSLSATLEQCAREFKTWHSNYASSTPFRAVDKNLKVEFSPKIQEFFVENKVDMSPLRADDQERYEALRSNLQEVFSNSDTRSDTTLTLVLAGLGHALDYYTYDRKSSLSYAFNPIDSGFSKELSKWRADFHEPHYRSQIEIGPDILRGEVQSVYRYAIDKQLSQAEIKGLINEAFSETDTETNVIFLAETHWLDGSELITSLPSPECVKLLGFKKVQVVLEDFVPKKGGLSGSKLLYFFENERYLSERERLWPFFALKKRFNPDYWEKLKSVDIHPTQTQLLRYSESLRASDIPVNYVGIDIREHTTFHLVDKIDRNPVGASLQMLIQGACIVGTFCKLYQQFQ